MDAVLTRLARSRAARRVLGRPFLVVSRFLWPCLPPALRRTGPGHAYGRLIHRGVRLRDKRFRSEFTRFMRNRPLYEKVCELAADSHLGRPARIAVVGCSTGAEVFSLAWLLGQWGVERTILGLDISDEVLSTCREARYESTDEVLEGLSPGEVAALFDEEAGHLVLREPIRSGITWKCCDIRDSAALREIRFQDFVLANNILVHLSSEAAELCLHNLASVLAGGGYLAVSGVDLDLKARVARDLRLEPVTSGIRETHHGYRAILDEWPWEYWGLEPYRANHPDHDYRYAMLFQVPGHLATRDDTGLHPQPSEAEQEEHAPVGH